MYQSLQLQSINLQCKCATIIRKNLLAPFSSLSHIPEYVKYFCFAKEELDSDGWMAPSSQPSSLWLSPMSQNRILLLL